MSHSASCRRAALLAVLLAQACPLMASEHDSHLELAVVEADPDQEFGNDTGFGLFWQHGFGDSWFAFGDYTRAAVRTEPHLNIYERSVRRYFHIPPTELEAWAGLGIGHRWPIGENHQLYLAASAQASEYDGDTDVGFGAHVGWLARWSESWETRLEFNHTDTFVRDQGLTAEVTWLPAPRWGLSPRTRDHDEWDYSTYELGLRYRYD